MALGEAVMTGIAVGLGCRKGVAASTIVSLVREAFAQAALPPEGAKLFTIDAKRDEAGLARAAAELGASLRFFSKETLAAVKTPTQSRYSLAAFDVSSVAESAALAGAGDGAVLIVPRIARDGVTCALARIP